MNEVQKQTDKVLAQCMKIKPMLMDIHCPFQEIPLLNIDEKNKRKWTDIALSQTIYILLAYGGNLKRLGKLIMLKNPVLGFMIDKMGWTLEKLGNRYYIKQVNL